MSKFSERITDIMNERHITQKQLAEMANVTESAMSYYVKGGRTPRIDILSRLAAALNVTTDYLLGVDTPDEGNGGQLQYLQRGLGKLNPEQLDKAEKVLRAVFDDIFEDDEDDDDGV
jgi:transcriptional regulator with XRE-family HTH domain